MALEKKAYDYVEMMVRRADLFMGPAPLWYGWALREAFLAGTKQGPGPDSERLNWLETTTEALVHLREVPAVKNSRFIRWEALHNDLREAIDAAIEASKTTGG